MPDHPRPSVGVACLGNDAVVEWVIAFCESLHRHNPDLPLTLIPFDDRTVETEAVLRRFGYDLYQGPALGRMDRLGEAYWPGEKFRPHIMRKFCAWDTYDTFLFIDADVVVLRPLASYFEAIDGARADFMHFATDMVQVYRPGPLRERMLADHDSAGFNSGVFMGRRGQLDANRLDSLASDVAELRGEFVDNLEQTLINYAVDTTGLKKVDANDLVDDLAVAGSLMRLTGRGDDLVLDDRRVPYSGRTVSMIHWAGNGLSLFMPYRRTFLRYRLAGVGPGPRWRYRLTTAKAQARNLTPRRTYHLLRVLPYRVRSWLSARGLAKWRGSQA
jgi:hypothetical protein